MIISASRRTDIPAFFGDWFMRRIQEGYFYWISPFNSNLVKGFSLSPADVDALIFWSKNPQPFIRHLDYLDREGYNYYFQFTLNDYPPVLEPHMPSITERITTFQTLSDKIGNQRVIWRYNPIILSSITPLEYHVEKISYLAKRLEGYTSRLVISFVKFYKKVENRLERIHLQSGVEFSDILAPAHREELSYLSKQLKKITNDCNLEVFTCSEALDLSSFGIAPGSCIDGQLINQLFYLNKEFPKDKGQGRQCRCAESVDVGVYNTCRFQCSYCYANISHKAIYNNLKRHRVDSPSLINDYQGDIKIVRDRSTKVIEPKQLSLITEAKGKR